MSIHLHELVSPIIHIFLISIMHYDFFIFRKMKNIKIGNMIYKNIKLIKLVDVCDNNK